MKILCIGDIVGGPGREAIEKLLPQLRQTEGINFVIANAENASGGSGLLPKHADAIFSFGVDVITLGDHVWDKKEIYPYLESQTRIVRPINFPPGAPGKGYVIVPGPNNTPIAVVNLLGRTFMKYQVECPFRAYDWIHTIVGVQAKVIIVDMHAETTSEKIAIGHYLDGRVSLVFGTHTHIQTADETILSKGTAYITDLGMSGPRDSVIGQNKEKIIERFLTSLPHKFEVAENPAALSGVIVDIDESTGKALAIKRVYLPFVPQA